MRMQLAAKVEQLIQEIDNLPLTNDIGCARQSLRAAVYWLRRDEQPDDFPNNEAA